MIPDLGTSPPMFVVILFSMIWISGLLWSQLRSRIV